MISASFVNNKGNINIKNNFNLLRNRKNTNNTQGETKHNDP